MKYYCVRWSPQANTSSRDRAIHPLQAGRFWVRIPGGTRSLSALGDVQTNPTANPSLYSVCAGKLIPQKESGRGNRGTIHLHLVSRVNKEWNYPSNPYTHNFMACKGTILRLSSRDKCCEVSQVRSLKVTIPHSYQLTYHIFDIQRTAYCDIFLL